jgi:hypothetical protein
MTSQDLLTLARQGNSKVIAALMNRVAEPQGIRVQVARQNGCLHVLLESSKTLDQQAVVTFVTKGIKNLKVDSVETIKIYGRQTGDPPVTWNQEVQLAIPSHTHEQEAIAETISFSEPPPILDTSPVIDSMAPITPSASDQATDDQAPTALASPDWDVVEEPDGDLVSPSVTTDSVIDDTTTQLEDIMREVQSLLSDTTLSNATLSDPASPAHKEHDDEDPDRESVLTTKDFLKRPEAVVLLLFVSVVMLWQLYLDLVEENGDPNKSLSGRELAQRLGVNNSTISRKKDRDDFPEWSQDLDPDGIAWSYQAGVFVPVYE